MKPEIKAALVAALESGEYKKGTQYLKRGECFCLEGVLCDLAVKVGLADWVADRVPGSGGIYCLVEHTYGFSGYRSLPTAIVEWAGLADYPTLMYKGERFRWYVLNDGIGKDHPLTFPELAKLIKEQM